MKGKKYIIESGNKEDKSRKPGKSSSKSSLGPEWFRLGRVAASSLNPTDDGDENLDWALVEISDQSLYRPNLFMNSNAERRALWGNPPSGPPPTSRKTLTTCRSVFLLSGTKGPRAGQLSNVLAYILLPPHYSFVEVYTLSLDDNSGEMPPLYHGNLTYLNDR